MSRLLRALRDVLPPRQVVWYMGLPAWAFAWIAARWATDPADAQGPLLAVAGLLYGFWRALGNHPLLPGHRAWLEQTPWTPGERLPLGPVRLVPQDALVLGALVAPALVAGAWSVAQGVLFAFLLTYSVALGGTFLLTRIPRAAYPLAFGLVGLALTPAPDHAAALAVVAGMALWTQLCLRASLGGFPWRDEGQPQINMGSVFPYEHLQHDARYARVAWYDGVALSALAGWVLYVSERVFAVFEAESGLVLMFLTMAGFVRLCVYLHHSAAPISVLGRLRTLRLVLPGFDKVFVTPLLALVSASALLVALQEVGASSALTVAVPGAAGLLVLLLGGPSLEAWRLTGYLRIAPPLEALQAQQQRQEQARRKQVAA